MSKIIDFHIHCGFQHNFYYDPCVIRNEIELQDKIVCAVVSSLSSLVDMKIGTTELLELSSSSKFLCTFWVNPYLLNWPLHFYELSKKIKIWGLKLHPTANIYTPDFLFLNSVWQFARDNNLFITFHTDTFRSSPSNLSELLIKFPDVNVVLIHMDCAVRAQTTHSPQ